MCARQLAQRERKSVEVIADSSRHEHHSIADWPTSVDRGRSSLNPENMVDAAIIACFIHSVRSP